MIKNITYIADYFVEQHQGGAELSDEVVIESLSSCGHDVTRVKSAAFHPLDREPESQVYVISNFTQLSELNKKWFVNSNIKYIIIERDQKYVRTRNTAMYKNFIAPKSEIVNEDFYRGAHKVFCLTSHSSEIFLKHIELDNITSLGCTHFSKKQFDVLRKNIKNSKNDKFAIVSGKRSDIAIQFCLKNNLEYEIIKKTDYNNFIKNLSHYKGIVFFSHAVETCCRLLVEARVLNLRILTDNKNGCTYENWFKEKKGEDLLEYLEEEIPKNIKRIEESL